MKKRLPTVILIVVLLAGLSLLLYPTAANYYNSFHHSQVILSYTESVGAMDNETYDRLLARAAEYNADLRSRDNRWRMTEAEEAEYLSELATDGSPIMGVVDVPSIDVHLPIYHTTEEQVLRSGVGHMEGSSLPVGGESTHCVLSGHRGLPSALLFTNLDRLAEGDTFTVSVLDEVLTYEVDRILIVEPDDLSPLAIEDGMDYCTLLTCTPYGINSHRMMVRGHRIANAREGARVTSDGAAVDPIYVAPVIGGGIVAVFLLTLFLPRDWIFRRRHPDWKVLTELGPPRKTDSAYIRTLDLE